MIRLVTRAVAVFLLLANCDWPFSILACLACLLSFELACVAIFTLAALVEAFQRICWFYLGFILEKLFVRSLGSGSVPAKEMTRCACVDICSVLLFWYSVGASSSSASFWP